jgi:predicted PurR-regulated permease PerM
MNRRLINNIIVGILITIIFWLSFLVLKPIIIPIIFGLLFAYIFDPIFKRINKVFKNRTLSAAILMLLIVLVFIIPLIYFTPVLIQQMFLIFDEIKKVDLAQIISTFLPFLELDSTSYSILTNLNNLPGRAVNNIVDSLLTVIVNLPSLILKMAVFLFTFFFTLRDSHKLKEYASEVSPFSKATETKFLKEFRGITNSVILGQVLIGIIQGLCLGLGLWVLGVPNIILWTIITSLLSIIPVVGPSVVWVPMSLFLFLKGDSTKGIILVMYGGLFVSSIDNVLRPYFLSKSSHLPIVISLIGTIGGLYFLGIIGLVIGPLILAYALIIIELYKNGNFDELYKEHNPSGIKSYEIKK